MDTETLVEAGTRMQVCVAIHRYAAQTPECRHWQVPSASVSMEGGMQQREVAMGKPVGASETQIKVIWVLYKI